MFVQSSDTPKLNFWCCDDEVMAELFNLGRRSI